MRIILSGVLILILLFSLTNVLYAENIEVSYELEGILATHQLPIIKLIKGDYEQLPIKIVEDGWAVVDKEERYICKINNKEYLIGYIKEKDGWLEAEKETMDFLTDYFVKNEDYQKESYKIDLTAWYQELEGIMLGKNIFPGDRYGLDLYLKGKLLQGQRLSQRHYNARIEVIEGKPYLSGFRDGIYSELNDTMNFNDVELTSYGYSLGYDLEWKIKEGLVLKTMMENIYSWIKWNNVYTSVMKYEKTALGFYSEEELESDSFGNYSYEDYVTHLQPEYDFKLEKERSEVGVFYRCDFYPYINYILLFKPIKVKTGFFREYVTLELAYKGIKLNVKTKALDFNRSSGIYGLLEVRYKF